MTGSFKKVIDRNPWDFMAKAKKVWILYLNNGDPFGKYETKAKLIADAKKYGISL